MTKRRSVKKEYQAAWLLKAISLIDLTTLSGDDTAGKVERLCEKAKRPISLDLLHQLGLQQGDVQVGAVCVYHHLIKEAKNIRQALEYHKANCPVFEGKPRSECEVCRITDEMVVELL